MIWIKRLGRSPSLVLILLASVLLTVRPATACSTTSCVGEVLLVYNSSPYTYIELRDKSTPPCDLVGGRYFRVARTSSVYNDVNAAALIALTTRTRLQLRMVPNSSVCTVQYSVLFADLAPGATGGFSRELGTAEGEVSDADGLDPKGAKGVR